MANTIDKVRIILVGDSGVGKTCFTHLIAHNECLNRPGWTVGCNIEVKLHEYKEGTPHQKLYFIELFDIGGSLSHKNSRNVFYTAIHGIILVHDLTNRKSHGNLRDWLYEILSKDGKNTYKSSSMMGGITTESNGFDPEEFIGATQIPILVVGTKLDLVDEKRHPKTVQKAGGIGKSKYISVLFQGSVQLFAFKTAIAIPKDTKLSFVSAEQCGAEEIWLNCRDPRSIAAGTTDAVKLARFFDRVIEKKQHSRDCGFFGSSSAFDRRRHQTSTPSFSDSTSNMQTFEIKGQYSSRLISPNTYPTTNVLIDPLNLQ